MNDKEVKSLFLKILILQNNPLHYKLLTPLHTARVNSDIT